MTCPLCGQEERQDRKTVLGTARPLTLHRECPGGHARHMALVIRPELCLRAPASDNVRLRHGDGAHGQGHRRRSLPMLPTLSDTNRSRNPMPQRAEPNLLRFAAMKFSTLSAVMADTGVAAKCGTVRSAPITPRGAGPGRGFVTMTAANPGSRALPGPPTAVSPSPPPSNTTGRPAVRRKPRPALIAVRRTGRQGRGCWARAAVRQAASRRSPRSSRSRSRRRSSPPPRRRPRPWPRPRPDAAPRSSTCSPPAGRASCPGRSGSGARTRSR